MRDEKRFSFGTSEEAESRADAPEFEIAREMLDAGAEVLADYEDGFDNLYETVERIFKAMILSRR